MLFHQPTENPEEPLPFFGKFRLDQIDEDIVGRWMGENLKKDVEPGTINIWISKLKMVLNYAKKLKKIQVVPDIERMPDPPKPVVPYDEDEIDLLIRAGRELGTDALVAVLLGLDGAMRKGEMQALRWTDLDIKRGVAKIQRNSQRGREQSPKGIIASVALSEELVEALVEHKKHGNHGPLVLDRRSFQTGWEWAPHTAASIDHLIDRVQKKAGVRRVGPHLLKHTSITHLADQGATPTELQAHARHTRLETTERYLHGGRAVQSRSAIDRLDAARMSKRMSKRSKSPAAGAVDVN